MKGPSDRSCPRISVIPNECGNPAANVTAQSFSKKNLFVSEEHFHFLRSSQKLNASGFKRFPPLASPIVD
jgi:hypothetical protein